MTKHYTYDSLGNPIEIEIEEGSPLESAIERERIAELNLLALLETMTPDERTILLNENDIPVADYDRLIIKYRRVLDQYHKNQNIKKEEGELK